VFIHLSGAETSTFLIYALLIDFALQTNVKDKTMKKTAFSIALLSSLALATACSPIVRTHGNMLKEQNIAEIQPMVSTRADVVEKWGPPTTVSSFDPSVWYYIGETQSRKGVFEPKVDKRQVIKVVFADDDRVVEAAQLDSEKLGKELDIVERKTPTAGKEFTALQQFIGNLGKYNTDKRTQ
jgi:outer membrane protein assembly factor BamE (lipoprotein component of BamABCDE complex)